MSEPAGIASSGTSFVDVYVLTSMSAVQPSAPMVASAANLYSLNSIVPCSAFRHVEGRDVADRAIGQGRFGRVSCQRRAFGGFGSPRCERLVVTRTFGVAMSDVGWYRGCTHRDSVTVMFMFWLVAEGDFFSTGPPPLSFCGSSSGSSCAKATATVASTVTVITTTTLKIETLRLIRIIPPYAGGLALFSLGSYLAGGFFKRGGTELTRGFLL